jgi:hypothetical protein
MAEYGDGTRHDRPWSGYRFCIADVGAGSNPAPVGIFYGVRHQKTMRQNLSNDHLENTAGLSCSRGSRYVTPSAY